MGFMLKKLHVQMTVRNILQPMAKIKPEEISNIIRKQIEQYTQEINVASVGTVLQVGDGTARVYGLERVMAGELLEFQDGTVGIALNLESDNVGVVLLGEGFAIQEGSSVTATGKIAQVPVGDAFLGRVVDSLAQPIDGKGDIASNETRLIESMAPGIISRRSVYEPLQTGLVSVDSMIQLAVVNVNLLLVTVKLVRQLLQQILF